MNLKTFWKPKMKIGFLMSSGAEIIVKCDDAKWTYSKATGILESYSLTGVTGNCPKYINVNEVVAIVRYS